MKQHKQSEFTSKLGFILATAGSAVGLGNLWRFPYLAAKHGGGIFLLVYLIIAVSFGFTLMVTELAIGKKTGLSAMGAYKALDHRFGWIGVLTSAVPLLILPYYSLIGGWVCKYATVFLSGQMEAATSDSYFNAYISSPAAPILFFVFFVLCTTAIVFLGVDKGIEKASKIMMPLLVVLTLIICIFTVTRPGALEGVIYYLKPDFSHFSITTVLAALGQLFYSMSLAMGILITYGSYMQKETDIVSATHQVEIFDTAIAFMAGLMIIPSVFVYSGGDQSQLGQGPGLMFVTLPKVFNEMTGGRFIGIIFFILVFFAALTSAIALMEACVSILQDRLKASRKAIIVGVAVFVLLLGSLVSLGFGPLDMVRIFGFGLLDFFDFISNSILMPIVAISTCIFVGFIIRPKTIIEEVEKTGEFKQKGFYSLMVKYVAPVLIIAILVFSLLSAFGFIRV